MLVDNFCVRHCSTWNISMLVFCCSAVLTLCLPLCRPFCCSACFCLSDGFLLLCWLLCRSAGCSAGLLLVLLAPWSTGRSRWLVSLSACAWCFSVGGYIAACWWSVPPSPSMLACLLLPSFQFGSPFWYFAVFWCSLLFLLLLFVIVFILLDTIYLSDKSSFFCSLLFIVFRHCPFFDFAFYPHAFFPDLDWSRECSRLHCVV